jgi:lysyl-tRNA synthetase class 2
MEESLTEQERVRREKLARWRELGVDPYPSSVRRTHRAAEIHERFGGLAPGEEDDTEVHVAGRIMAIRRGGKLVFLDLHDESAKLQILVSKRDVAEGVWPQVQLLDIGDIVGVCGTPLRTRRGELSLKAKELTLLCKGLSPLPEKWHGLRDPELRLRRRYLDLMMDREVREVFYKRARLIREVRSYLEDHGFMEVETPTLEHIPGGADARPFCTHHNALDIDLYLRISLELHLKRLIVGGFEKVYELGRVFRNEGMSTEHLQEFTLLEFYWAYADYQMLMAFLEPMYCRLVESVTGGLEVAFREHRLDFTPPWPRIDYRTLFLAETGIDLDEAEGEAPLVEALRAAGIEPDLRLGRGRLIDQLFKRFCRPKLIQPCFLVDHPIEISPLAKRHPDRPGYVQRFQIVFAGSEVGNGFSELNDPLDQAARFEEQAALRARGDEEAQMYDRDFVRALQYGMPPTAGFGVGIDRLLYILLDAPSVREVVLFPTMRPERPEG